MNCVHSVKPCLTSVITIFLHAVCFKATVCSCSTLVACPAPSLECSFSTLCIYTLFRLLAPLLSSPALSWLPWKCGLCSVNRLCTVSADNLVSAGFRVCFCSRFPAEVSVWTSCADCGPSPGRIQRRTGAGQRVLLLMS